MQQILDIPGVRRQFHELLLNIGNAVLVIQRNPLSILNKIEAKDIVTQADMRSEKAIASYLQFHFPGYGIRGEEGTHENSFAKNEWIIDPIDGTIPYANGMDYFGISIGLIVEGNPMLGAIKYPGKDEFLFAYRCFGASLNFKKILVEPTEKTLAEAMIGFDFSAGGARREYETERFFKPLVRQCRYPKILGSSTGALLECVKGQLDGFVHPGGATVYDIGAAYLIAKEAGLHVALWDDRAKAFSSDQKPDFSHDRFPILMARNPGILQEIIDLFNAS
jgi:myo-inositol-1(or 4)-monophosphatase